MFLIAAAMWGVAKIQSPMAIDPQLRIGLALTLGAVAVAFAIGGVIAFRIARTTINPVHIDRASRFKEGLIVAFREIGDRTAAEQWRNRFFLVPRTEVPAPDEGQVYVHELLGMDVRLDSGEQIGAIEDVYELPQGLAIDVRRTGRSDTVLLLYDQSVRSVDRDARVVVVTIPDGLLE